jgi:hypothetical protein
MRCIVCLNTAATVVGRVTREAFTTAYKELQFGGEGVAAV